MFERLMILAQTTTAPAAPTDAPPAPGIGDFLQSPLILIFLFLGVLLFLNARSRKKEQQKYEDMLNALKRNDRVQTIGGVIGTVVEVREGEVVLKVDESSNTKLRFTRSAIKGVIQESGGE